MIPANSIVKICMRRYNYNVASIYGTIYNEKYWQIDQRSKIFCLPATEQRASMCIPICVHDSILHIQQLIFMQFCMHQHHADTLFCVTFIMLNK